MMLLSHKTSILKRLVIASLLALPVLMLFSAVMLDKAMEDSLITAEHEKLRAQIYSLLSAAEFEPELFMPEALAEVKFNQLNSGLYAKIELENGAQWLSQSADLKDMANINALGQWREIADQGAQTNLLFNELSLAEELFYALRLTVIWEQLDNKKVHFMVMHRQADLQRELNSFRWQLLWWLVVLMLALIIAQTLILKFGLKPLLQLSAEVKALEEGRIEQLSQDYVKELQPLAKNMNQLVQSLRQQQQRFRHALDDLAHSLKTPLTIIVNEQAKHAEYQTSSQVLNEQIERMQDIIQHQLKRANRGVMRLQASPHSVAALLTRLNQAMSRLYQHKNISFDYEVAENIYFLGIADDLMEILGNLLENAYKYSVANVNVSATLVADCVQINIDDDGAGIPEQQRQDILKRGVRADSKTVGQGLGLSVALDIVDAYQGQILITTSPLGGARFTVTLPGIKKEIG